MAKLMIHAGMGKTGTSSIQVSLLKNEDELSSQGIVFLEANRSKLGKSAKHRLDWGNPKSRSWKELRKEAKRLAKTERTVVISNEALWRNRSRQLRMLKKAFKGFDYEVILYVREQVEFLESRTLQFLKSGRKNSDLDFSDIRNPADLDQYLEQFLPHLDYLEMAKRIEKVFGKNSVRPRLYSRNVFTDGNVVADFLEVIGAETERLDLGTETNPSLSVPFTIITTNHEEYLPAVDSRSEIIDAGLRLSKKHKSDVSRLIPVEKAQEIRDRFADSNEAFFSRYVENADGFVLKPWKGGRSGELEEFTEEMRDLIENWPLVQFNRWGPKRLNPSVFREGWQIEEYDGGFSARQVGDESRIRFRVHLRARSRSKNCDLQLLLKCSEPNGLVKVRVGDGEVLETELSNSSISIPSSHLGEFDNVEITFINSDDSPEPLSISGLRLEEQVSEMAPVQQG